MGSERRSWRRRGATLPLSTHITLHPPLRLPPPKTNLEGARETPRGTQLLK